MYRFLLTPRWIAGHIALIVAVAVCLILGSWQADAFRDSKSRHNARDQSAVPLTELVAPPSPGDIGGAADRAVTMHGEFDPNASLTVPGRVHDDTLGSYVVTILHDDNGIAVPVLRGWSDQPVSAGDTMPSESVQVTGHILAPEGENKAVTQSEETLDAGQISHITPDLVTSTLPDVEPSTLLGGFVVLSDVEPLSDVGPASTAGPTPVSVHDVDPIRDISPWQNASYWAQWWVFALAAVIFWASAVRAAVRSRRGAVTEPDPAPAPS